MKKALLNIFTIPWQRTLTVMFFAQMISAIGFSSIFPFLPLYVKSLGSVGGFNLELLAGLVFSSQALTMMLASPFWGALADRYGRKLMVERAMFGGAIILVMMAFVRSAEELVLLRALQGMITGTIGAANALVASAVPRNRTGYAMGLLQVGLGGGIALGPMIGGTVADAYGYRAAFYVTGFLLAIAGALVYFGVDEQFVKAELSESGRCSFLGEWRRILTAPGVTTTYGLRFMNQLGRMILIPILPLFVLGLISDSTRINGCTGMVIGIASAAATLGAIYLGRVGDRIGHRQVVIICSLFGFLFFALQSLVTNIWQLLILQVFSGAAIGGIVPGISALLARYTQIGEEGAVYGLDNSINAGARTLAPLLGVGIGMGLGLRAVFGTAAILYLAAGLLAAYRLPKHETAGITS